MNRNQAHALVQRQADAWQRADLDAIVADFAAGGLFISPGGRWQGQAAIRAAAQAFFAGASDVQITIHCVLIDGDQGAAEWTWSELRHSDQQRHSADDAIIFTVTNGQITYWREYFDRVGF